MSILRNTWQGIVEWWYMPTQEDKEDPEEDAEFISWASKEVTKRQMTVPAIIFLESIKPMNFISNQLLVGLSPIVLSIFKGKRYDQLTKFLEKRGNIERLLQAIEDEDAKLKK